MIVTLTVRVVRAFGRVAGRVVVLQARHSTVTKTHMFVTRVYWKRAIVHGCVPPTARDNSTRNN